MNLSEHGSILITLTFCEISLSMVSHELYCARIRKDSNKIIEEIQAEILGAWHVAVKVERRNSIPVEPGTREGVGGGVLALSALWLCVCF